MDIVFIDDKDYSGDETPERITSIYELGDGSQVHVILTREGVIMDHYNEEGSELLGTWAATPDEIAEHAAR